MKLKDIVSKIDAKVVCGENWEDSEIEYAFASDLMSDVLTVHCEKLLLITGLCNLQTIRTAEMSDIQHIVLVRNKKASQDMVELAEENDIVIIECPHSMYRAVGELYQTGLKPVF
ncbi:MAG: DRTGG domain-containing protein [Bacteroidales bacterium]|jgi:serine kinase of HPr protein (carbohydrate metabolism regulator)